MPGKKAATKKAPAKRKAEEVPEAQPPAKKARTFGEDAAARLPQAAEAAGKLLEYMQKKESAEGANALLPEAGKVFVNVQFMQSLPGTMSRARRSVQLPHGIYNREDEEVCLITTSPQRKWKDKLAAAGGNANVKKVIDMNKLRKKFKAYNDKRQLATGFSLFVADEAVVNFLPKLLGKTFFSRRKEPITINMKKFPASLETALASTSYSLRDNACVSVCIGKSDFSADEIAANCRAVVDDIVKRAPSGWRDVHSIQLKGSDTPMLPIYAHLFAEAAQAPPAQHAYPERHTMTMPEMTVPKKTKQQLALEAAAEEEERVEAAKRAAKEEKDADDESDALSDLSEISGLDDEEGEEFEEDEE